MINKVILIGNVGADPEVRALEGGVKVARVRLATTERIYNRQTQEAKEHTEWHTITLWRNMAETADRFVKKGSRIYVEGRLRSRDWTDEAGNKRNAIEILADDLKLLDRRPEGSAAPSDGYGSSTSGAGSYSAPTTQTAPQVAQAAPDAATAAPTAAPVASVAPTAQPAAPAMDDADDLPF